MLARSDGIPRGRGWMFEPKLDGFRCLVCTHGAFRARSRRGWDMSEQLPELCRATCAAAPDAGATAPPPPTHTIAPPARVEITEGAFPHAWAYVELTRPRAFTSSCTSLSSFPCSLF